MRFIVVALAMLIGTAGRAARARADDALVGDTSFELTDTGVEDDAATAVSDADPGPRLPNGEPAPPPDLVNDAGGCSCRATVTSSPAPFAVAALLALAIRRRR